MIGADCEDVWRQIQKLPSNKRPNEVKDAFFFAMMSIERDTGLVRLSRQELAERAGLPPESLSKAMSVLVELDVFTRETRTIKGYRTKFVQWRVNGKYMWRGRLSARKAALEEQERERHQERQGAVPEAAETAS
jgi:hypothetical protein